MPLLFSYGTLQQEPVQLATFGRPVNGERDALRRYERAFVPVIDATLVARYGMTHTDTVTFTGHNEHSVEGTALDVTDAELARSDEYEAPFDYRRVVVTLASGRSAWVYLHDGSARE